MQGRFEVSPSGVDRMAARVSAASAPLDRLVDGWLRAADGIDTGDPALDRQTAQTAAQLDALCREFGRAMAATARRLEAVASGYREGDAQAAAGYRILLGDDGPSA